MKRFLHRDAMRRAGTTVQDDKERREWVRVGKQRRQRKLFIESLEYRWPLAAHSNLGGPGELFIPASPDSDVISPHQRLESQDGAYFAGEFLVHLAPQISSASLAGSYGLIHQFAYPNIQENINVWRLPDAADRVPGLSEFWNTLTESPEGIEDLLAGDVRILDFYPVYQVMPATQSFFSDSLFPAQWHLMNTGQTGGVPGLDANVLSAWDLGVTGRGVTIGVLDDGADLTHPDLRIELAARWDFITNTDSGNYVDGNHGTAVAGVAAARGDNGVGTTGVAPHATVGSLRMLGGAADIASALRWSTTRAASGSAGFDGNLIDIYNNSWGPNNLYDQVALSDDPARASAISQSVVAGRGGLGLKQANFSYILSS